MKCLLLQVEVSGYVYQPIHEYGTNEGSEVINVAEVITYNGHRRPSYFKRVGGRQSLEVGVLFYLFKRWSP
jgi:hypothetical protein